MNLREAEAQSIQEFIKAAGLRGLLSGRVLDYGCGQQPYRSIVENHGGEYFGYDRREFPANVSGQDIGRLGPPRSFDAILCTQVLQYIPHEFYGENEWGPSHYIDGPAQFLDELRWLFKSDGHLIMTYPTNWPEVEMDDLHRFTKAGMELLLTNAGYTIVVHNWRHGFKSTTGESFTAGYGVIARA